MTGHLHRDLKGEPLFDAARAALTTAGEQWTEMRALIYAALCAQASSASAYDIAEGITQSRGRRVAANTVYRILDLFVRTNLARRVESANAYVANPHPGCRHDCIFLICDRCGKALHLDDDRMTGALRDAAQGAGFTEVRPVIELRGTCETCALNLAAISASA